MNLARVSRPASIALAAGASALLLAGVVFPAIVVGAFAVGMAWLRPAVPPSE
ncbi:MAG: hypothetical protein WCP95_00510 [Actinomycetes bacterium]